MKKKIFVLLLVAFNHVAYGQNRALTNEELDNSGPAKMIFLEKCNDVESLFKANLKRQMLFLLLQSGIAPVVVNTDKAFEDKYQVYFYDFGCNSPKPCVCKSLS